MRRDEICGMHVINGMRVMNRNGSVVCVLLCSRRGDCTIVRLLYS